MKKHLTGLRADMYKVKPAAFKRELKRQGVEMPDGESWGKLDKSGFAPEELQRIHSEIVATREEYVSEGTSSGAVSNAYRNGWDAVFGKGKRGQS